jgi:hypothetical protein
MQVLAIVWSTVGIENKKAVYNCTLVATPGRTQGQDACVNGLTLSLATATIKLYTKKDPAETGSIGNCLPRRII